MAKGWDDDASRADRQQVLLSASWPAATNSISLGSAGLLSRLIKQAARASTTEIPVSVGNVNPEIHGRDVDQFPAQVAELRLRGLITEVRRGVFSIAPGLWKVGVWDPNDKDWFPGS